MACAREAESSRRSRLTASSLADRASTGSSAPRLRQTGYDSHAVRPSATTAARMMRIRSLPLPEAGSAAGLALPVRCGTISSGGSSSAGARCGAAMGPLRSTSGSGGRDGSAGPGSGTGSSGSSRDGPEGKETSTIALRAASTSAEPKVWVIADVGCGAGTEAAPKTCVVLAEGAFAATAGAPKTCVVLADGGWGGTEAAPKTCVVVAGGGLGGTEAAPKTCVVVAEGAFAATAGAPKTCVVVAGGGRGGTEAAPKTCVVVGEAAGVPGAPNTWVFPPGARGALTVAAPKTERPLPRHCRPAGSRRQELAEPLRRSASSGCPEAPASRLPRGGYRRPAWSWRWKRGRPEGSGSAPGRRPPPKAWP